MKLYTEEQVIGIYRDGFNNGLSHRPSMEDIVINKYQTIELPSDEEIEKTSTDKINILNDCFGQYDYTSGQKDGFIEGAYWMREQVLSKNK